MSSSNCLRADLNLSLSPMPIRPHHFQEFINPLIAIENQGNQILVTVGPEVLELPVGLEAKLRPLIGKVIGIVRIDSVKGMPEYFVRSVKPNDMARHEEICRLAEGGVRP